MSQPDRSRLTSLSKEECLALIRLLSGPSGLPHDAEWFAKQKHKIENLPKALLRPSNPLARTLSAMKRPLIHFKIGEEGAQLCKVHKPLNPQLIRRVFLSISQECTIRNQYFQKKGTDLPDKVYVWTRRIESINSLWMSPQLYFYTFNASSKSPHYERVLSGCEACIVATVGSNLQIILDLHASLISRDWTDHEPHLLRFVTEWLHNIGGSALIPWNEEFGDHLMTLRETMRRERYPNGKRQSEEAKRSSKQSVKDGQRRSPSMTRSFSKLGRSPSMKSSKLQRTPSQKTKDTPPSPTVGSPKSHSIGGTPYRYVPPSHNPYEDTPESEITPSYSYPEPTADLPAGSGIEDIDSTENNINEQPVDEIADSILDYYLSRYSMMAGEEMDITSLAEGMHPAFRNTMFGNDPTGQYSNVGGKSRHHPSTSKFGNLPVPAEIKSEKANGAYTASVYSQAPSKGYFAPSSKPFDGERPRSSATRPPTRRGGSSVSGSNNDPYGLNDLPKTKERVELSRPLDQGRPRSSATRPPTRRGSTTSRSDSDPYGLYDLRNSKQNEERGSMRTGSISRAGSVKSSRPKIALYKEPFYSLDSRSNLNQTSLPQQQTRADQSTLNVPYGHASRAESIWIDEDVRASIATHSTAESSQSYLEWKQKAQEERDEVFRNLTNGLTEAEFQAKYKDLEISKSDKSLRKGKSIRPKPPPSMYNSKNQGRKMMPRESRSSRRTGAGKDMGSDIMRGMRQSLGSESDRSTGTRWSAWDIGD
ncbi:hypothetical protein GLAREA_04405 [Glarea lozoyensis ATCC 20868]|uniref:Uncharacterized protein n=1 Tax=Glarea lozoyensis (strain ATCC 20868 / MF5171) TaxID=1116229 RepID=S3CR82_GLAL2|nr:uncharacterized protein GLAREA_04405 [Glarea lozoyensis ATCC 20868]EPE27614.1 hypothetical protein GLAREA_04405 [Glarea lozoyensis ATCC 20868]